MAIVGNALDVEVASENGGDLPARTAALIVDRAAVKEELDVALEGLDGNCHWFLVAAEIDVDLHATRGAESHGVHGPSQHHGQHVSGNRRAAGTVEAGQIGIRDDFRELLQRTELLDRGFLDDGHIVSEHLLVVLLGYSVTGPDHEFRAVDIREFCAVAVFATDGLLFRLVVVGRGQKLAEDELGNHHLVLGMGDDRNTGAVIENGKVVGGDADTEFSDLVRRCRLSGHVIQRIHDDLVEDLEEAGIHLNRAPDHLGFLCVVDPATLFVAVP